MKLNITGEDVFQVNGHTLAISKAPAAYTLQFSVTGDFSTDAHDVCSVAAGEPCTGMFPYGGLYFRCYGIGSANSVTVVY